MNEEIKSHLIKYCESKGWEDTSDKALMDIIVDAKTVWEGKRDRHRWYTLIPTVVEISGMFLMYNCCDIDGEESSVEDCIGGYKLEDVVQVVPQVEPTIIYKPV